MLRKVRGTVQRMPSEKCLARRSLRFEKSLRGKVEGGKVVLRGAVEIVEIEKLDEWLGAHRAWWCERGAV